MTPEKGNPHEKIRRAEVSLQSEFATKIINGQIKNRYIVEISFYQNEDDKPKYHYLGASDEARSLLLLACTKHGITRTEALDKYFILSLTQHVSEIRKHCGYWDVIDTERVGPKRYARYHLSKDITIRLFKIGGQ
jgi:hypothetical protein